MQHTTSPRAPSLLLNLPNVSIFSRSRSVSSRTRRCIVRMLSSIPRLLTILHGEFRPSALENPVELYAFLRAEITTGRLIIVQKEKRRPVLGGAGITAHLLPTATVVDSSRVRIPQLRHLFSSRSSPPAWFVVHNNFILQITTATILSRSLLSFFSRSCGPPHGGRSLAWLRPGERKIFDDERLLENRTRRSPPMAPGWSPGERTAGRNSGRRTRPCHGNHSYYTYLFFGFHVAEAFLIFHAR